MGTLYSVDGVTGNITTVGSVTVISMAASGSVAAASIITPFLALVYGGIVNILNETFGGTGTTVNPPPSTQVSTDWFTVSNSGNMFYSGGFGGLSMLGGDTGGFSAEVTQSVVNPLFGVGGTITFEVVYGNNNVTTSHISVSDGITTTTSSTAPANSSGTMIVTSVVSSSAANVMFNVHADYAGGVGGDGATFTKASATYIDSTPLPQLGIGTFNPDASASLDIESTTSGVLLPRMTTTERNAIASPATGLEIFNTTTVQFEFWNGSAWTALGGSGVSSITGTANQVIASASTGAVTLSLPQSIDHTATPTFQGVFIGNPATPGYLKLGGGTGSGIRFYNTTAAFGGNFVELDAPSAIATSIFLTMPNAQGGINSIVQNDGSGTLSFTNTPTINQISTNSGGAHTSILSGGGLTLATSAALTFQNSAGSQFITIQSATITTGYNLNLPPFQGAANTFLQNDGSGNLSFVTLNGTTTIVGANPITPDALVANTVIVTVGTATTINGPINGYDGQKLTFRLVQDATGHTVTFVTGSGNFEFGTDITSFTASGANLIDYVGIIYNSGRSKWDIVSVIQGF